MHSYINELLKLISCKLALVEYLLCGKHNAKNFTGIILFPSPVVGKIMASQRWPCPNF